MLAGQVPTYPTPRAGLPLPHEGGFPGGGSPGTVTVVNSSNGVRFTGVPITGWIGRGGMPIDFSIFHNSVPAGDGFEVEGFENADLGSHWTHSYDMRGARLKHQIGTAFPPITLRFPDGRKIEFTFEPGPVDQVVEDYVYRANPKSFGYIKPNELDHYWTYYDKNGLKYFFRREDVPQPPSGWLQEGEVSDVPPSDPSAEFEHRVLDRIDDLNGNAIKIFRTANKNQISKIVDPSGRELKFEYGTKYVRIEDPAARSWEITGTTGPSNTATLTVRYPALADAPTANLDRIFTLTNGRIQTETDLRGKVWSTQYDSDKRCIGFQEPHFPLAGPGELNYGGHRVHYIPATASTPKKAIFEIRGHAGSSASFVLGGVEHLYGGQSLTEVSNYWYQATNGSIIPSTTILSWGPTLNGITGMTDPRGYNWTYQLDGQGNPTSATTPGGVSTFATYDANSRVTGSSNQTLPSFTRYGYTNGVLTSADRPPVQGTGYNLAVQNYLYQAGVDPNGLVTSTTEYHPTSPYAAPHVGGNTTLTYEYTTHGHLEKVKNPAQREWMYQSDAVGKVLSAKDPLNNETKVVYDDWDRPTKLIHPGENGGEIQLTYDGEGNVLTVTNEKGQVTSYTYSDNGLLLTVTDPLNRVTSYGYNAKGEVVRETNAKNESRYYTRNLRGDLIQLEDADGTIEQWIYDAAGNVVSHRQGVGTTDYFETAYTYDSTGRLTNIDRPGTANDIIFEFDRNIVWAGEPGNVDITRMRDAVGESKYLTDGYGTEKRVYVAQPGSAQAAYIFYPDINGRNSKTWQTTFQNSLYKYDNLGRLSEVVNPQGNSFTFSYDAANRLTTTAYSTGGWETITYDNRSRPIAIEVKNASGTTIQSQSYTYDVGSNVLTHTVDGATTTYTYDVADQLISESGPWGSRTYSYDANGNRTYGAGASYTYGPGDRLLSRGNETFTYDGLGRMKTRTLGGAVTTYNWDYDSRLVSVVQGSTTVQSNVYLGSGARVRQTEGGTSRNFRREGVGVTDPITYDGVAHITPGLARTEGGVNTSVFGGIKSQDLQVSGSAVASRRYDAFGVPVSSSGTWKGASAHGGFYGYQENPTTGLQLLGHRYYDPTLGRFISKDPIGSGSNWYAYCDNNPLNATDPTGLQKDIDSINATISRAMLQAVTHPSETIQTLRGLLLTHGLAVKTVERINKLIGQVRYQRGLMETHHYLPRQFGEFFSKKKIDIEKYTGRINAEYHRLIHGKLMRDGVDYGGYKRDRWWNYNREWKEWIDANRHASKEQILERARYMAERYGLSPTVLD